MSETFRQETERLEHETLLLEQNPTRRASETAKTSEQTVKNKAEALADALEAVTKAEQSYTRINPVERLKQAEKAPEEPFSSREINQELQHITLERELQHLRYKLSAPQRVLSKIIHRPLIRFVSEGAGNTVSRPSGLLGGGLVSLLGTSSYLYLAKHYGYRYNYLVFLLLFVGGFFVGLILELFVHLATASRRQSD